MATLRSDIIIPEIFTPYVIEQTTQRDAFLASGVVQPMAELNATEGGDFINVPFFKANLTGDFEVLSDSTSLTPGKITADKQVGVILQVPTPWLLSALRLLTTLLTSARRTSCPAWLVCLAAWAATIAHPSSI
jgi:hypothetical protein